MLNEAETTNIIVFTIIITLTVFFSLIVLFYFLSLYKRKKYSEAVDDKTNSVRIIIIDKENETVQFFNRSNIKKIRTISLDQFFVQFPTDKIDALSKWINSLINGDEGVNDYFEIDVYTNSKRRTYYSLLQILDVNKKNKKIYIESYLFKNGISKNKNANKNSSTVEDVNNSLLNSSPFKGITFYFKFPIYQKNSNNEDDDRFVFTQIKNYILQYTTSNRFVLELSKNEIALFDLKMNTRPSAIFLIHQIMKDVYKFLSLHGVKNTTKIAVGVIENRHFPKDIDKLLKESKALANLALEDEVTYLWYEKSMRISSNNDETYRSEVERIIRDQKLKYTFRPIIEVSKQKAIGYLSFIKPFDTFVDSFDELKEYALKTEEDKELLSTVMRNIIPRFINENYDSNARLFIKATLQERSTLLRIISHLQNISSAHIVILFDEYDVHYFGSGKTGEIKEVMSNFQAKGFEVGLILSDKDLVLQNSVYECFNYYLVNFDITPESINDSKISFKLRSLVEKLLKYKKPIIANGVEGWNIIELLVKSKFEYITSETIAPQDEMFLPLPTKNMNKLKSMM